jgi:signal transduction histidine kinase
MTEDSDRLEELLNRMLRLARVEQWAADGVRQKFEHTDLISTWELAIARMSQLSVARSIRVEFGAEADPQLRADPADLELVWVNLLENAIKYSRPDSTVKITLTADSERAKVVVQDFGCGIPESELPHIFERFHRGDPSRARATGGFGLGLTIAKSVVDAYNGTIGADSVFGKGTCIHVELPIDPEAPESSCAVSEFASKEVSDF